MRILLTTSTFPPSTNGVAVQTQLLFQELEKLGHDVRVLAPEHPQASAKPHVIYYPSLPNPIVKDYPLGIPLISPKDIFSFKPEVVHTQHPLIIAQASIYIAHKLKAPLFFTHHSLYQQYINYYIPDKTNLTVKLFNSHLKKLAQQCYRVICNNQAIEASLHKQDIQNTYYIPNGIDVSQFKPSPPPPSSPLSLIYVGRLAAEKEPLKLLKLASYFQQHNVSYQLTLVGDGRLMPKLKQYANKHELKHVTFTGTVSRDKLPNLLSKHLIFITFSKAETMPLTYQEAQACGLPIALPQTNTTDYIPSKAAINLPSSIPEVANILRNICENKSALEQLRQQSLDCVKPYSIHHTATQHLKLYQQALGS